MYVKDNFMKKHFSIGFVLLLVSIFVLAGCESEKLYTCNNRSSYSVTVTDSSGNGVVISPGSSQSIYLLGDTTLNDIYYTPADLVSVSLSGQIITFRDR
jgi:ABC-type Fe3+-hydroxamate transport system substrate-binding protein